jgi:AraC-like DNA-binding protein
MEMHMIFNGSGYMEAGGELFPVSENTFIISFPEDVHRLIVEKGCKFISQYSIFFRLSEHKPEFYSMLKDNFRQGVQNSKGFTVFSEIERLWNSGDSLLMAAAEYHLNAFILEAVRSTDVITINQYVEVARNYMWRHVAEKISLDKLCRYVGLEKSYFCRLFKRISGETPMQYFMRQKIELCKEMLNAGERNSDIAAAAGFADEFHFSRSFKKITGMSPRQYKDK